MSNTTVSLLENPIRISTPYVKIQIGNYTFGVFSNTKGSNRDNSGIYKTQNITYPNYVQSLTIKKINGQVNQYTLNLSYPITTTSDPNFFEKVFSSVSKTRKIIFSYGDQSAPKFLYKDEEAIITKIQTTFNRDTPIKTYTISATSCCKLATAGSYNFTSGEFTGKHKPSDIIKKLLKANSTYGLQDIFTGMQNYARVISQKLIAEDDCEVNLEAKTNISILDYITYLVSNMKNASNQGVYRMIVVDGTDDLISGVYFKIVNSTTASDSIDTYDLTIGYPSSVIVKDLQIEQNENYSILYNYSETLNTNEYVQRIDDSGNINEIYSPIISSNSENQLSFTNNQNWWKNVTEYPISATVKIQGVLRPTVLMSKVRLNILYYGNKDIYSGLYLINEEVDEIGLNGCWTTLKLIRTGGDNSVFGGGSGNNLMERKNTSEKKFTIA